MMHKMLVTGFMLVGSTLVLTGATPATYDRAVETTLSGTVLHVAPGVSDDGTVGVHLDVKSNEGVVYVAVAPALFIGEHNFWFFAGDRVQIIGVRMEDGTMWARAIMKGSAMLVLRNEDGTPKWIPAIDGTDGCGVVHQPLPRITE